MSETARLAGAATTGTLTLRIYTYDQGIWFPASDVATLLGWGYVNNLVRMVPNELYAKITAETDGKRRALGFLTEGGVRFAASRTSNPTGELFICWFNTTVKPVIPPAARNPDPQPASSPPAPAPNPQDIKVAMFQVGLTDWDYRRRRWVPNSRALARGEITVNQDGTIHPAAAGIDRLRRHLGVVAGDLLL